MAGFDGATGALFCQPGEQFVAAGSAEDVDAVARILKTNGVALLKGPEDTPWQTRELAFRDDQGHTIYVGQSKGRSAV